MPNLLFVFAEVYLVSHDELFQETAQIFDNLDLSARDLLVIFLQFEFWKGLVDIQLEEIFKFLLCFTYK